jgi:transcriptional regulator with XRE-family HTH domain
MRAARERLGLSQVQVFEKTGIHNMNLSHYERGKREPDLATLVNLCSLYRVSVQWMIMGHDMSAEAKDDLWEVLGGASMFCGVPLTKDDHKQIIGFLTGMFWDRLSDEYKQSLKSN